MIYQNPVVRGFYPDPSVCRANGKYYLVCSSFQMFPGVPIFESTDMVNWKQIGHCLTRKSQYDLDGIRSSGGIFAPTIRYNDGRFYMVTTNDSTQTNFYVTTDDIYGEWSEPIVVDQDGIDPSLFFEDGRTYFISNGSDETGRGCVQMCEIDVLTGEKKTKSTILWHGTGGRYMEAPHLYRFGDWYYLLDAEGGTEYGHMVNYARSKSMWGPFDCYPQNPVLTNRNLGGYVLQGAGHGDILEDYDGNWWFMHLAFRQIDRWATFHHLGREVCLEPLNWDDNGWFRMGVEGTAREEVELPELKEVKQNLSFEETFSTLDWNLDWIYLRYPVMNNYIMANDSLKLRGTKVDLNKADSPTLFAVRQKEFVTDLTVTVDCGQQESGVSVYMDETHHYDLVVEKDKDDVTAYVRYTIGNMSGKVHPIVLNQDKIELQIQADAMQYHFRIRQENQWVELGNLETRYLSSEVAGGFTGVIFGLYAVDSKENDQWTTFTELKIAHKE